MALERIDPILLEDLYAVDHLLRYSVILPLVEGRRVLDAACGRGFGTALMALSGAREVVGRDLDPKAVEACRAAWQLPNATFDAADVEVAQDGDAGAFDVITSFETLEHVRDPQAALQAFAQALAAGGLLIGSVPAETDRLEANPFHLHAFTEESLSALLRLQFPHVRVLRQRFRVASCLEDGVPSSAAPLQRRPSDLLEIDFGTASADADSFFFMASAHPLPEAVTGMATSRRAWELLTGSLRDSRKALDALSLNHRRLFQEQADLKVKFTHMLAWGKWHFEELNGRKPEPDYLEKIAHATSQRESQLREQVAALQEENLRLQRQLEELQTCLSAEESARRAAFVDGAQNV